MERIVIAVMMTAVSVGVAFGTTPTITDVTAQQRYPWNGKVDISYTVTGNIAEEAKQRAVLTSLKVSAIDMVANTTNTATQLSGDLSLEEGTHAVVWDMGAEGISVELSNTTIKVSCEMTNATYCVIDLSEGVTASSYPTTYLAEPPIGGFNVDEYKTTKLVLKRIEAGSFIMGDDQTDESHRVTLTEPFFCGIFEVTQKQYQQIMGSNPSAYNGDMRPVDGVSYNMIRGSSNGAKWPSSSAADTTSFIGMLRTRMGQDFDIPTNAQWEYACRAGTKSKYNNGGNTENDLAELGRYVSNQSDGRGGYTSAHTTVGSYNPNDWGLYDMHGNVWEWCLDWYGGTLIYGNDPTGPSSGSNRILRGGTWKLSADRCTPSDKGDNFWPTDVYDDTGFRLVRTLPTVESDGILCSGTSVEISTRDTICIVTTDSTSGCTLTNGNTYVIQNSVEFSNSEAGGSGISVADNATVVLYVPAGVTLTAVGAHGSGRIGGGAGIRVPETSTLIITGEGMVIATGGNAGDGADGEDGLVGSAQNSGSGMSVSGVGGSGGAGGGGAGAAIGGSGGAGGEGGEGGRAAVSGDNISGNNGNDGNPGAESERMGSVYVLGKISIETRSGMSGMGGVAGSFAPRKYSSISPGWKWSCGGGGGGGGSSPFRSIGAGGQGGGGGGGGGSGAIRHRAWSESDSGINPHGGGGCGGLSGFATGETAVAEEQDWNAKGGKGGLAGNVGVEGNSGTLYVSSTATINVERDVLQATTHPAAQYIVTLDANGGEFPSLGNSIVATLGCELPDNVPIPHKGVARFVGWSYDQDGIMMAPSVYTMPSNTTLYAVWESLHPVFTYESGTTFDNSLSVSISCPAEGAIIHYTTDGSDPTIDSPVYRRFRISGRTTVKAIAEEDGLLSDVVTAEYALGQCADPMISPSDGASFEWDSQVVSINWQGEDGVLRYTTDGSDPTAESPVYEGPFTISDTTVVKAKAFGDQFFDSAVVTATITRVWDVAIPYIHATKSFTGSKAKVVISCVTDGATVRYTLDGSEPNSHSMKYTGPFYVTDSCMIKAYAGKYDCRDSAVATHFIEKVWDIGDTLGKPDHGFTTDGSDGAGWVKVDDTTAPNGEAMKSGVITHNQSSVLSTTVMGPGKLAFSWRTSCEDSGGQYDWDHAEFAVDGTVLLKRDGISSWAEETVRINGDGEHTVTWTYKKDDVEKDGDDAAYVAGYGWVSDYTETKTTDVPIPYAWLLQNDPEIVDEFDAYEAAANATAANGHNKIWECYVAGISPTNEAAEFSAKIEMKDGVPVVTWEPNLNTNGIVRTYKVYGSETLENGGDWQYPTNSLHRFFKVTVEMP